MSKQNKKKRKNHKEMKINWKSNKGFTIEGIVKKIEARDKRSEQCKLEI